jgi:vacuolar-type H+-ATPase subunit E/Vma4
MALQDILNAITAQTDLQITEVRTAHQKKLTEMRESSERAHAKKKQEIAQQKEQRKLQLKAKAEAHAQSLKRNALLTRKQALLDKLYGKVVKDLAALPEKDVEALLRTCLKKIGQKGTIAPSKKHEVLLKRIAPSQQFKMEKGTDAAGGFMFSSEKQEYDFTFEHLVSEYLRPETELEVSHTLFTS